MTLSTLTLTLALLLALTVPLNAQQLPEPGQRVRVTLEKQPRTVEGYTAAQILRGEVTGRDESGIMLRLHPGVGPAHVAYSAVQLLEVSRGIEAWYEGAWRHGKDLALLLGLEFFAIDWVAERGQFSHPLVAGLAGAGIGMSVGAIIGAILPQEIWEVVPIRR